MADSCSVLRAFGMTAVLAVTLVAPASPAASSAPPAGPALVLSARAVPWVLPASGGFVNVTGRVKNASSCQLELLSSYAIPVGYSRSSTPCGGGNFSAQVTFGANLASVGRTVELALVARSATSMSSGRFYVHLVSGYQAVAPTPVLPAGAPSLPVKDIKNPIWSGYVAVGGPYSAVRGTFTVPALGPGTPRGASVSEWVGVDGLTSSGVFVYPPAPGTGVIQAGVYETPDPRSPDGYDVQPWGESFPAPLSTITGLAVKAGDKVTVAVWEAGPDQWKMQVADDTNGLAFTMPPEPYAGPGVSAEWVVERPSNCNALSCLPLKLAAYSPSVSFSAMGMAGGRQTSLWRMLMMQGGQQVATPSAFSPEGFSVSYTGPKPAGSGEV
jgi:hypothetical protein